MRRHARLDRLERAADAGVCDRCGRALHGTVRFVPAEATPTPEDFIPCPGCHRARVFTLNLGSAVEDDLETLLTRWLDRVRCEPARAAVRHSDCAQALIR